jgi:hypothetical protein
MTESTLEKCVAMICIVLIILAGKVFGVTTDMVYMGITAICAFTGLGTGNGRVAITKKTDCAERIDGARG